ncbi:MAG: NAD-dependent epimerase/dehydratase family protein [Lachnospiraceae bacterium]|nr:NAD-dependent epimerase/dehydratase family protein [Lachnospiraceae bacterium]
MLKEIYLITGAGGHLGGAIIRELRKRDKKVRALLLTGEKGLPWPEVEVCYGDVCDWESLRPFFAVTEVGRVIVIHCAGIVTIQSNFDQRVMDVNVGGTKNILEWCRRIHADKLIYVSSVHAIPEQKKGEMIRETTFFSEKKVKGLYAKSKAAATALVLEAAYEGLNVSVVHPSGIIGPYDDGDNHVVSMIRSFCRGRFPVGVVGGYDFVDVRDVAKGVLSCVEAGVPGLCYILSGHYYSVKALLALLSEVTGRKAPRIYLPAAVARSFVLGAAWVAKMTHTKPVFTNYSIYTLGTNACFSYQRARQELHYHVRPMRQTLEDTVRWLERRV